MRILKAKRNLKAQAPIISSYLDIMILDEAVI